MHGENAPEHQKIAVKGAGTTLMRQIYEFAKMKEKPKIVLHSSKHSEPFYREKLKMKPDGEQYYQFDVSGTSVPESLLESDTLLSADKLV